MYDVPLIWRKKGFVFHIVCVLIFWSSDFEFCTHTLTHLSLTHTHTHTHSVTHTDSLTHTLTHSHSCTHSLTHSCAFCRCGAMYTAKAPLGSPPLLCGRRGTMCTAKRSDVRPGVLGSPPLLRGRCGTISTAKGLNLCPGVLGFPLLFRGRGGTALPRGRMYAMTSLGFPPLLRGRRPAMYTVKGADVRPGVPCVSAWHNLHWQGVGRTAWRPFGLRLFCVVGVDQIILPWGRIYTFSLASLGAPQLLRGRCGTIRTAKGSDVRPGVPWVSASFACQAWDNVHCQGVGCLPWRPWLSASFVCKARNVYCQGVGCMPWLSLVPGVV